MRCVHRTNIEYAEALEVQDRAILSKCTTQCSDKCIYHTIVKAIIPQHDNTGPVDLPTLLQRYRDSRPKEALRPLSPAHLASDIQRLKVMCFSKCPLTKNKELFEAIDARQQSIDILQLHGNVKSPHTITRTHPDGAQRTVRLLSYKTLLKARSLATFDCNG